MITRLNPKPGLQYNQLITEDAASAIVPDFMVEVIGSGTLRLTLLSTVPELEIEKTLRKVPN